MAVPLLSSPLDARKGFLLLTLVALVVGGVMAYQAVSNEITGQAIYHQPTGVKSSVTIHISRESDPAMFRKVTNFRWGMSLIFLGVVAVSFTLFRKLDDCV